MDGWTGRVIHSFICMMNYILDSFSIILSIFRVQSLISERCCFKKKYAFEKLLALQLQCFNSFYVITVFFFRGHN